MAKSIEKLLKEKSKGSLIQIPESLLKKINKYQEDHKKFNGTKPTREQVVIKMMAYGEAGLTLEIQEMKEDFMKS